MFMGGDARTIASKCRISQTSIEAHIRWVGEIMGYGTLEQPS
jgi:hypothetical protein